MNSDKLTVKVVNEEGKTEDREAFMSFALLNALVRVVGDPTRAATLDLDPDVAQMVLTLTLIPRSPTGKPLVSFDDFELPGLDPEEAYKILDWVREHILDFFVTRLKKSLQTAETRKDDLKELGSLTGGSALLPSSS